MRASSVHRLLRILLGRARILAVGLVASLLLLPGCASKDGAGTALAAPGVTATFDRQTSGKPPEGWSIRQTRPTEALATWEITGDASAPSPPNVLALTETENRNGTFNLAIADRTALSDLDLTVKVKGVRGEEDQGGGPIWRCTDENNYYVCRFNPLEGNYRVYKVVGGRRRQLGTADVETDPGKWYTVRVTMIGDRITCYLDGRKLLEVQDDTFPQAGKIGLWTKADAVTSFDDLTAKPVTPTP